MKHRIDALMMFLACESSESESGAMNLLSESNLKNACEMNMCDSIDTLKEDIYDVYLDFGADHALGVFQVTVNA